MNSIRAIFFDIDGTLVGFKSKVISDRTIEALQKLRDQGIMLIICSGRPRNLIHNLKDFKFDGYITMNGTHVEYGDEVLLQMPLCQKSAVEVSRICEENHIPVVGFSSSESGINFENEVTGRLNRLLDIESFPIVPMVSFAQEHSIFQYTVYVKSEDIDRYFGKADPVGIAWHRWHPEMADIIPFGTSKAVGVEAMIRHLGIERSETLSFGDGGNDIPMFRATGLGVAMGNASEEVKAVADYVTSDADADGIVSALNYFGLVL